MILDFKIPESINQKVLWITVFGSVAISITVISWSKNKPICSSWKCHCGSVEADVNVMVNYAPSAECHCSDCIKFAKWMETEHNSPVDVLTGNNGGACMGQIYKDELNFMKGIEKIRTVKLTMNSFLHRYYTSCCGTPLGLCPVMKSYPMLIFYRENFTEKGAVFGSPWFRLNYRKNEDPPAHSTSGGGSAIGGSVPTSTGLHPGFILVTLTRALYGVLFGRGYPDPVEHFPSEVHVIDEGG